MGGNLIDIMADRLKEKFPSLSMDEGCIIAHAYIIKEGKSTAMTGNMQTPPDGCFNSTVGLGFLNSPGSMKAYCMHLVTEKFLCEHESEVGMVRISDPMIPICESIINSL